MNLVVIPNGSLLEGNHVEVVQRLLAETAPRWSGKCRVWSRRDRREIDLKEPGSLFREVREDCERTGSLFPELQALIGPKPFPRSLGGVELRGASPHLIVVLRIDEYLVAPNADEWIFGNRIVFQMRGANFEGQNLVDWCARVFEMLCGALSPLYGSVYHIDEYDSKNMSHEDGAKAIGVDVSKHLPGVYWVNYFGAVYCDLMGADRLLGAPAAETRRIGPGVLLRLADDPSEWASAGYRETEGGVLDHVGRRFFFSRESPERPTVAPAFELPERNPESRPADLPPIELVSAVGGPRPPKPGPVSATDPTAGPRPAATGEALDAETRRDLDALLNAVLPFAKGMLTEHGEFYPVGATVDADGGIALAGGATLSEAPGSVEVIDLLVAGFRDQASKQQIRASAVCFDSRVQPPGTSGRTDAVCARLEHRSGRSVAVFLPYRRGLFRRLKYGELFSLPAEPQVFVCTSG